MKIISIFVTYNLELKRFIKLSDVSQNVIFIDNSLMKSTDEKFRRFNVIRNEENLGYGGGANVGIKVALEQGAEWIILMNQDLTITRSSLDRFTDFIKQSNYGVAGPFSGGLDERRWTTILASERTDYISGECIAIHRDVVDKIGNFFDSYFMYYEDADYCIRAKKAGFPLISQEITGIQHSDKSSLGKGSFLHQYYLARNHLLFVERQAPLSVKFYECVRLLKSITESLGKGNEGTIQGIKDYLLKNFGEKKML